MNKEQLTKVVNDYINNKLLTIRNLPMQEYPSDNLKQDILNRLFLRRFRKYATTDDVKQFVNDKITNIMNKKLDMIFVPSFGGYKHWWTPSYPACDWAEVINMKFLLEYLSPVMNSYKDGNVLIHYESEEVILAELNNIPQTGLDIYTRVFRELAEFFNGLLNKDIIKLVLAKEQYEELGYSKEKLLKRIEEVLPEYEKRFDGYDPDDQARRIKKVSTNFNLQPTLMGERVKDYTQLNDEELYDLFKKSRVLNEAFLDVDYEFRGKEFFENEAVIPLLFSFGLGPGGEYWPHIGSCSSSMVDFWAGLGILVVESEDRIIERIVSKTQFDLIKDKLVDIPVDSPIAKIHDNFKQIYVYEGKLDF